MPHIIIYGCYAEWNVHTAINFAFVQKMLVHFDRIHVMRISCMWNVVSMYLQIEGKTESESISESVKFIWRKTLLLKIQLLFLSDESERKIRI